MNRYFKFLILLTFIIFNDSYYLYSDTLEGISISYGQRNWRSSTGLIYDLDSSDIPSNKQGPNGFSDTLPDNDNYKIFSFHIDFKENHKSRFFYWDYYLNYYNINNEYFNDNNSYFKEKYFTNDEKLFTDGKDWGIVYDNEGGSLNFGLNVSLGITVFSNHRLLNIDIGYGFSYLNLKSKSYLSYDYNKNRSQKLFDEVEVETILTSFVCEFYLYRYKNDYFHIKLNGIHYIYPSYYFYDDSYYHIKSKRNINYIYEFNERYINVINFGIKF